MDIHITNATDLQIIDREFTRGVTRKLDDILTLLRAAKAHEVLEMATMQDVQMRLAKLQTDVLNETSVVAGIKTFISTQNQMLTDLKDQLAAAIQANDPAALQQVADTLDAITTANTQNADSLAANLVANTPAAGNGAPAPGGIDPATGARRQ